MYGVISNYIIIGSVKQGGSCLSVTVIKCVFRNHYLDQTLDIQFIFLKKVNQYFLAIYNPLTIDKDDPLSK